MAAIVKHLVYSDHSRTRMRERGIDDEDVRDVVRAPDMTWPSGERPGGLELRRKFSDGRTLHICIQPEAGGERHRLVTAFWVADTL